jgi:hypothetical protein
MTAVNCSACGTENRPGRRFCSLLGEARSIFEGLRATPWLERVAVAESAVAA